MRAIMDLAYRIPYEPKTSIPDGFLLLGTALWIYGYFVTGHPSWIDWHAHTPWWIADYMTNLESRLAWLWFVSGVR